MRAGIRAERCCIRRPGWAANSIAQRATLRQHFYWDDVPQMVMTADDLTSTATCPACWSLVDVPFIATDHAGRLQCPSSSDVGERDSVAATTASLRPTRPSKDVTLFILERSGHCHNSDSGRHLLWDRLGRWFVVSRTDSLFTESEGEAQASMRRMSRPWYCRGDGTWSVPGTRVPDPPPGGGVLRV